MKVYDIKTISNNYIDILQSNLQVQWSTSHIACGSNMLCNIHDIYHGWMKVCMSVCSEIGIEKLHKKARLYFIHHKYTMLYTQQCIYYFVLGLNYAQSYK